MPRIAIGVLASAAPRILAETLRHWAGSDFSVFIHVDAKFDLGEFAFVEHHPNARIIPTRHKVMWGGFSLVEAEVSLMEAALAERFDYFLLLSDDTIPLVPASVLGTCLQDRDRWKRLPPNDNHEAWRRYENYFCADIGVSNPRQRPLEYALAEADLLLGLHVLMKSGKFPLKSMFWSSNWKALPFDDVVFVVRSAALRGLMHESFRYAMNPDEHYIQTMLGLRDEGLYCIRDFIWADFSREPKPYVLTNMSDVGQAAAEGYLFARKVHDASLAREAVSVLSESTEVGGSG